MRPTAALLAAVRRMEIKCEDLIKENIESMKSAFRINCELSRSQQTPVTHLALLRCRRNEKKSFLKIDPCCLSGLCWGI